MVLPDAIAEEDEEDEEMTEIVEAGEVPRYTNQTYCTCALLVDERQHLKLAFVASRMAAMFALSFILLLCFCDAVGCKW